jgi:hypothetical protein
MPRSPSRPVPKAGAEPPRRPGAGGAATGTTQRPSSPPKAPPKETTKSRQKSRLSILDPSAYPHRPNTNDFAQRPYLYVRLYLAMQVSATVGLIKSRALSI